jgi:uncharacterized protein
MKPERITIQQILAPGLASGKVLRLSEPLSFWGGYNSSTGTIIDRAHAETGQHLTGSILVMQSARGSSSSSSVLAESIRLNTAPSAIVLGTPDPILPVGALVAEELYGRSIPIIVMADIAAFQQGAHVAIDTATHSVVIT